MQLCTLLLSLGAFCQEEFVPSPAKLLTSFPFKQFSGGVVVLQAKVNDLSDTLNFILDTGSGGISLDSTTCDRLRINTTASNKTIRGIAGIRTVRFAYNNTLRLPGLRVDSLNFHINDYEILSNVYGEHIDGIIGYSFFTRYIVKINYDDSLVFVYSKGSMKYPRGGFLLKPLLVNIPIQSGQVKEEKKSVGARFYFDTGAGLCMLLSTDFISDSLQLSSKKKIFHTQAEGLGGKADMRITVIKEFRLGPYRFKKVPSYIFTDEYNVTSYPYLGGLIGNDLLRRFNLTLNYEKKELYLIPNSHFREPFDYAYTGLGFYFIDGEVRVTDVMKDSPAERAGFKPDDVMVAINNNFSRNIQVYKNLLQNAGQKMKILVMRDGQPIMITLKVQSIL
ncbi:MAG: aspartyl protease family protein [Williamsia sp.]|nr:aspartyl protease family protein [Williamsia sp.]